MISSIGETWVYVQRANGVAAEITSDEFGVDLEIVDKPVNRVDAKMRLYPSDVKVLYDFFGRMLEQWDEDEI